MRRIRPPRELRKRLLFYLSRHEQLSSEAMFAWTRSCRKPPYSLQEFDQALYDLRDGGAVQCVNGLWYIRGII